MARMGVLRLAALLLMGALAPAARAAEPPAPPEPVEPGTPLAPSKPAKTVEPSPPLAPSEPVEPAPPPAMDAPLLVPGELPPPRAIAVPPAARRKEEPLLKRTALTGNLAGLVHAPAGDHAGTWRAELALERAVSRRVSAVGILSAGELRTDGRDGAWVAEVAGQYRWYFLGRVDRGLYAAGTLGFWAIDPYLAWALGGGLGLKHTGPWGLTVDLQAGLQLPVEWFRHDTRGNPPRFRDAWRTLLPGVLVNAGWSFEEATAGNRRRRR
jgi:hypothetical protein